MRASSAPQAARPVNGWALDGSSALITRLAGNDGSGTLRFQTTPDAAQASPLSIRCGGLFAGSFVIEVGRGGTRQCICCARMVTKPTACCVPNIRTRSLYGYCSRGRYSRGGVRRADGSREQPPSRPAAGVAAPPAEGAFCSASCGRPEGYRTRRQLSRWLVRAKFLGCILAAFPAGGALRRLASTLGCALACSPAALQAPAGSGCAIEFTPAQSV